MSRSEAGKRGYAKTGSALRESSRRKHLEAVQKYESNPKTCPECSKPLPYELRQLTYCDHSCAASFTNRKRERKLKYRCSCGAPVLAGHRFCDSCWVDGNARFRIRSLRDAKSDRGRRSYLLRVRGHRCSSCNLEVWLGEPIPLELDHADGNPDNNTEENLRLLCPNCHALTDTYKGKNRGNSRRQAKRRKRYQEGKTF